MIFARLDPITGLLSDIREAGYASFPEDVELVSKPKGAPGTRYKYDAVNKLAIPVQMRKSRLPNDILADLFSLTDLQRDAIRTDINSGTPSKWRLSASPVVWAEAPIFRNAPVGSDLRKESLCMALVFYCIENPNYLVNPSFDATINISGDEPDV